MEIKRFKKINNIVAVAVLAVASFTYLATIEPTVSFWDCGEFIASSYKLEIGHAPGNPVFQLIARFFTLFGDKEHAAVLVNAMSALCSALTIFFLYLTIVHLARRILEKDGALKDGVFSTAQAITLFGAGAVGALAYCWSDTFWFSAVEGEVYAMSSLFTAVVFWAMLKWEEQAEEPYAGRWLVFIALMMGLSIGVHLLNLLTIPAMGFIYYFRKCKVTKWGAFKAFLISCVILAFILWGIIPFVPKIAAVVDLLFVNTFGLPVNSGAAVFFLLLLGACFYAAYRTYLKKKVLWNTISLCLGAILIGYSVFAVVIIRSAADTPTNENQPDNPYSLVRYLGREQYGSAPLLYGAAYTAPVVDVKVPTYHNIMDGKYEKLNSPAVPVYGSEGKMLFPRMYSTSSSSSSYAKFYEMYTGGTGNGVHNTPTAGANLKYFFDYQIDFMYIRYFMWNFVGRQNDLQASVPGDIYKGNWESGIGFLDKMRLGDQSEGPDYIVNSKAKNHFYFLPLILGLIGLFYQLRRDKRNFLVTIMLFFLTGIAIVLYLNQTPYQARERDYAYAGSFYVFAIWIGFAVLWLGSLLQKLFKGEGGAVKAAVVASVVLLLVPVQMVSQTWDDHDRSGRYTCRDLAYNYLAGLDSNALLVTHGDNDTFPLWYIQEVEGVRTDVRIINTSLLGTDWYIDQMKRKQYESDPVPFTLQKEQYYYGKNDFVPVLDLMKEPVPAEEMMDVFKDPTITVELSDNQKHNVIAGHHLLIPVNKENVKKYGIVAEKDYDKILDTIQLDIPDGVRNMSKTDLLLLDLLAHYQWDRPLYFLQKGGDVNIGEQDYMQFEGFYWKFVPIKSKTGTEAGNIDQVNSKDLYDKFMNTYRLESLANTFNVDYQNLLTFNSLMIIREAMTNTAKALFFDGDTTKAVEILDKMQKVMLPKSFPLNNSIISSSNDLAVMDAISLYLLCGEKEKGLALGKAFEEETEKHILLFSKPYHGEVIGWDNIRRNIYYLLMLSDAYLEGGAVSEAAVLKEKTNTYIDFFNGSSQPVAKQPSAPRNADTPAGV